MSLWTLGALSENDAGKAPIRIDNSDSHGLRKIAELFGVFRVAPTSADGEAWHQNVGDDFAITNRRIQRAPNEVRDFDLAPTGRSR